MENYQKKYKFENDQALDVKQSHLMHYTFPTSVSFQSNLEYEIGATQFSPLPQMHKRFRLDML